MVNRRVIEMAGLDPDEWQGFAWGLGVDRLAMLKYGMDDLRAFFDGDARWLAHYGFGAFDQPALSAGVGARACSKCFHSRSPRAKSRGFARWCRDFARHARRLDDEVRARMASGRASWR